VIAKFLRAPRPRRRPFALRPSLAWAVNVGTGMGCHRVGLAPVVSDPIRARFAFRGVRHAYGEAANARDLSLRDAQIDCQLGIALRSGQECLSCPRILAWQTGPTPRAVTVLCRFGAADPVSARMTGVAALVSVRPEARCVDADRIAARESVHRLLVVDGGIVAGIVCRHDLGRALSDRVAAHMQREVYVIDAATTLGDAATAMWALEVGCLPVTHDHRLVGIVTRGDLVRAGLPEAAFTGPLEH
jgi:hypothetical protein